LEFFNNARVSPKVVFFGSGTRLLPWDQDYDPLSGGWMPIKLGKPLVAVSVILRGSDLDPDLVTKLLGIEPSRFQKRGGFKHKSQKFVAKFGLWSVKSSSRTRSFNTMIDDLLNKFRNSPCPLDEIEGVQDAQLDIFVGWADGPNESREFNLTKMHTRTLAQLGLAISFSADKPDSL
jgi:hypothetical protein